MTQPSSKEQVYEQALRDIVDPIAAMRRDLPEGYKLDGHAAYQLAGQPETYKDIARKALATGASSEPADDLYALLVRRGYAQHEAHAIAFGDKLAALSSSPPPSGALPDAIVNVAELLHTQDNRITRDPIFVVQVKKRIYGIDPDWGGDVVWLSDGDEVTDQEELKRLETGWENGDDDPDGYTRTSYQEYWETLTACFTEAGCESFLRCDGHNHRGEKRIYALGSYRNAEWAAVRAYLMSLRASVTKEGEL